jgi:hypothetical protein
MTEVEEYLKTRREAGSAIDPDTAEVMWRYAYTLDPYGQEPNLPEANRSGGNISLALRAAAFGLRSEICQNEPGMPCGQSTAQNWYFRRACLFSIQERASNPDWLHKLSGRHPPARGVRATGDPFGFSDDQHGRHPDWPGRLGDGHIDSMPRPAGRGR